MIRPIATTLILGAALAALAFTGPPAAAQPDDVLDLVKRLKAAGPEERYKIVKEFEKLGPKAAKAIPELKTMVNLTRARPGTLAEMNDVLAAGYVLYCIGNDRNEVAIRKQVIAILDDARRPIFERICEAQGNAENPHDYDVILNNKLVAWSFALKKLDGPPPAPPGAEPTVEELRKRVEELTAAIEEITIKLKAAEEVLAMNPDSAFWRGTVQGYRDGLRELNAELEKVKRLLAEKEKQQKK